MKNLLMKDNANQSSDLIITKVMEEQITSDANKTLAKLNDQISELKRQHAPFEIKISSSVESHLKILDMSKNEILK